MKRLAIHGGKPVRDKLLPYGHQLIDQEEIDLVTQVLKSDYLTQGGMVDRFEEELCRRTGAKYAIAVSSGTAALHLAILALTEGVPHFIHTSPLSFVATANAILYAGSQVVLTDINKETLLIDSAKYPYSIPVHYAGLPNSVDNWGDNVIEDACHSLDAWRNIDRKLSYIGSHPYSLASCFSFHPVKMITTGEGGAVVTNDEGYAQLVRSLRNHGRDSNGLMTRLGFNYRLSDINCAVGIAQLGIHKSHFKSSRYGIALTYSINLAEYKEITLPLTDYSYSDGEYVQSACHLYPIRLNLDMLTCDRDTIKEALIAEGIGVQVHYMPIYSHPYYKNNYNPKDFPNTEDAWKRLLSLPIFPAMSNTDVFNVISALDKVLRYYRKEKP